MEKKQAGKEDAWGWDGRRVLVTGGAGFIGSHLTEALLGAGAQVTVLDDLSTGCLSNLRTSLGHPNFELTEGSILDRECLEPLIQNRHLVVHLAAVVGVNLVLEQPVRTLDVNVEGTRNVLSAAGQKGAAVLFASSSEVYGRSAQLPFREQDSLLFGATSEPRWAYAASKAIGEWEAFARAREEGLRACVVRLFNTVGPRQAGAYGMVLPRFVAAAVSGEPLMVYGDGKQTRAFCHVADVVTALLGLTERLLRAREQELAPSARVFNVGGNREVSIEALARLVRRLANSDSEIVHVPYREAYGVHFQDLRRRLPDVSRLERELGWRPTRTLEETVEQLITMHSAPSTESGSSRTKERTG